MKQKFLIAAGLLCLGAGPAFSFAIPAMAPDMAKAVKQVWTDQWASEKPGIFDTGEAWMSEPKPAMAPVGAAAVEKASLDMPAKEGAALAKAGDTMAKASEALAAAGPSEPVMQPTSTPAAAAYPACRPGAGDDHCIQLYERGVRAQLAEWNRSAAGSQTAMGGPYEPVDTTLAGEMGGGSMNGDGVIDRAAGETADAAAPAGSQYTGMGGPLEEVAYPPCSRTVTDRCIQLYERGRQR